MTTKSTLNDKTIDPSEKEKLRVRRESFSICESDGEKKSFRNQLLAIFESNRFHFFVIVLITIDCILVFGELMIDLKLFEDSNKLCYGSHGNATIKEEIEEDNVHLERVEKMLHYCSIALLGVFLVEVTLKIYAYGRTFFQNIEEMIDAVIIIVSFVLDLIFIDNSLLKFLGVIIFLRLWRILRIVHAIMTAVKTPLEDEICHEHKSLEKLNRQLIIANETIVKLKAKLRSLGYDSE